MKVDYELVHIFGDLAKFFSPHSLEPARQFVKSIKSLATSPRAEEHSALLVVSLAQCLPNLQDEALIAIREIPDEHRSAWVLRKFMAYAPPEFWPEVLEIVCAWQDIRFDDDEMTRQFILEKLAPYIPKSYWPKLLRMLRANSGYKHRFVVNALRILVSYLPPALLDTVLNMVRTIEYQWIGAIRDRAEAFVILTARFPALLEEALGYIRELDAKSDWQRAKYLAKLAEQFPELLPEAIAATRAMRSQSSCADQLVSIAAHWPELQEEAFLACCAIEGPSPRFHSLLGCAEQQPALANRILPIIRAIASSQAGFFRENPLTFALTKLAPSLPELREEALALVLSEADGCQHLHSSGLRNLAEYLTPAQLLQALEAIATFQTPKSQAIAIAALAPHLKTPDLLTQAQACVQQIPNPYYQAEALSKLLPMLPLTEYPPHSLAELLHSLAHRKQDEFLSDIPALMPALAHLGGEVMPQGVVNVMRAVCNQWK